ncbi:MAG: PEGA domain-containing protein [Candidatus Falkowbacteria bacterium]|nr:MAG: PEGA domain-containing protein [Candidatus Falkowbacteria bacterium]
MSKKVRDCLFYIFIVIFSIMTILISLYASGYKFNLSWPLKFNRLLQKTGMLNVATVPKNAYIFLNGKEQTGAVFSLFKKDFLTTPNKIKNILPGEYALRLEREGYWPYEKKIRIDSGQTTFAEDINLFRSDSPLFLSSNLSAPLINGNGRYIYLKTSGQIINLKDNGLSPIKASDNTGGHWIKNGDKLFAGGKILDFGNNSIQDLTTIVGAGVNSWYYSENDDYIYYATAYAINRLESGNKTATVLLKGENYLSYEPRGETIFAVVKTGNKISLKSYSLKTGAKLEELELPTVGNYSFKQEHANYLCLYDNQNLTLYLIDPLSINNTTVIKGIKSWSWINSEEIIYHNDWEINTFNIKTGKSFLITRVSEAINDIIWHHSGRYFIFSTASNLNAADLQTGTVTSIARALNINDLALDEKNNLLYFQANIDNQPGLYKLLLQ